MSRQELHQKILDYYRIEELKGILFALNIHPDRIPFTDIDVAARELIIYCGNRGMLNDLIDYLREERPNVDWPYVDNKEFDKERVLPIATSDTTPPYYRHFTGRERFIKDLSKKLKDGKAIALHGMAGVGKTTLASKLSEHLEESFSGEIYWGTLDATNARKILESWGYRCDQNLLRGQSLEVLSSTVKNLLTQRQRENQVQQLFVIDTVSGTAIIDSVHHLKNALPRNCSLLLLSRNRGLTKVFQVSDVRLPPVSPETALAMFKIYSGSEAEPIIDKELEQTKQLLNDLGYLPLAIELAAGILKELKDSPRQRNIKSLCTQINDNLKGDNAKHNIRPVIWAVFNSSYDNLPEDTQKVFRWLGAFSPAEPIRLDSIEGVLGIQGEELDNHLKLLSQYAMLKWESALSENSQTIYRCSLHQLLHLFARTKLQDADEWETARQAHLSYYFQFTDAYSERDRMMHDVIETKLTNILLATDYAEQLEANEFLRGFGLLLATKSRFLNMRGYTDLAKVILSKAKYACAQLEDNENKAIIIGEIGWVYHYEGNDEKAIELINEALNLAKDANDKTGEGIWHERLGEIYRSRGDLDKALEYYGQALEIHKLNHNKQREAITIGYLGLVHSDSGELQKAIEKLNLARELYSQSNSDIEVYNDRWLDMLGTVHRLTGNLDEAKDYFQQAIKVYLEIGNLRVVGEIYGELGLAHYTQGEITLADEYFEKAFKFSQDTNNQRGAVKAFINKGLTYRFRGEVDTSIKHFDEAIKICDEINDIRNKANALAALGIAYRYLGDNRTAIKYHQDALQIRKQIGDRRGEGSSYGNIGNSYLNIGLFDEAVKNLETAIDISKKVGDQRSIGNAYDNLGRAYYHQGYAEDALSHYFKGLEISRAIKQRRSEANRLGRIGNAYRKLGRTDEGIEMLKEALTISKKIADRRSEGNHAGYLGKAYFTCGQLEKAKQYLSEGLELARKTKDKRKEGVWLSELGTVCQAREEYDEAHSYYHLALEISRKIENMHNEGICLSYLGSLYQLRYERQQAIEYLEKAFAIQKRVGDKIQIANVSRQLGIAYWEMNEIEKAEECLNQSLQIYSELEILVQQLKITEILSRFLLAIDRVDEAKKMLLNGLALCEQNEQIQATIPHAFILGNLGIAQSYLHPQDMIEQSGGKGYEILEQIGDQRQIGEYHTLLGEIYLNLGEFPSAKSELDKALNISRKISDLSNEERTLSLLGKFFELKRESSEKDLQTGAEYYYQALEICRKIRNKFQETQRYKDLSRIYLKLSTY